MDIRSDPPRTLCPFAQLAGNPVKPRHLLLLLCTALLAACGDSSGPDPDLSPASIVKIEGDGLEAPFGTAVPLGPTVEVQNAAGEGLEGISVTFSITSGGGTVWRSTSETDWQGRASVIWILGYGSEGVHALQASADGLTAGFTATPVEPEPGDTYFGRKGYTQYMAGDLPLVISAPHGGDLHPDEIPDRSWGTTRQDRNTRDLALRIRDAVHERTGGYPHMIISNLHRIKLDPNREIEEAAQGDFHAQRAWWEFQTYIEAAEEIVARNFQDGFYIDLHGHGHDNPRLELGYLLGSSTLALSDTELNSAEYATQSSLRSLALTTPLSFSELLRGVVSLGGLLEERGFPAVPSPLQPDPGGEPYFTGGYNTSRHGSVDGAPISGVQIECHYPGLRDTEENREAFAQALASVLPEYFLAHFGRALAPLAVPARLVGAPGG